MKRSAILCYAMAYHDMKPTESKVYSYLICKCIAEVLYQGESDKIRTLDYCPTAIGKAVNRSRANVSRALAALIARGDVCHRNGRIWPSLRRIEEVAHRAGIHALLPLDDSEAGTEGVSMRHDGSPEGVSIQHTPGGSGVSIQHAPRSAPLKEAPAELNSDSGEERETNQTLKHAQDREDSSQTGRARVSSVHAISILAGDTDGGPPHPWTADDEARIVRFSERWFASEHLAREILQNVRGLYPVEWVIRIMKRARLRSIGRWPWLRTVLRSWDDAGGPDPGEETGYDDDMKRVRPPILKAIPSDPDSPLAARPSRFPVSNSQRVVDNANRALALIRQGINPSTGKPFEDDDV